jgi:hypothetical protein
LLVDVVTYSGERDLLKARLDILQPDVCIAIESNITFTGKPKRFTFQDNPVDGVTFVPFFSPEHGDPWLNEYAQRDAGHHAVTKLEIPGDAVVGFFDVDEIPDPEQIRKLDRLTAFVMAKYQASVFWYEFDELTGVAGPWSVWQGRRVSDVRQNRALLPAVNGGWHFSSMLDEAGLLAKWSGFSHTEFWRPDMAAWIRHCLDNGLAIQNGEALRQVDKPDIPEAMFDGPDFWYRQKS